MMSMVSSFGHPLVLAQADSAGRLRDWWTNSTVKAFDERAQCIARQYSKYYVLDAEGKKVFVNGNVSNHIY
jgi:endothelin-converting enzyme